MECDECENVEDVMETGEAIRETTIFDIPVQDIMVDRIAKFLRWEDLVNLRCCSRSAQELADRLFEGLSKLQIIHYTGCLKGPFPFIFRTCRKLRKIYLSNLAWLTNELLVELLCNNPNLEFFHISLCPKITATGLLPLATHNKKLLFLFMPHMNFDDEFLNLFNQHNHQLLRVDFAWNKKITGPCLQTFFENQPNLTKIRLTYVKADISTCLQTIAKVCRKLYYMDISHCVVDVDDHVILGIADNCPDIRTMFTNMNVHCETKKYLRNRGIDTGVLDGCKELCCESEEHRRRRWEREAQEFREFRSRRKDFFPVRDIREIRELREARRRQRENREVRESH
ncbi:F-box/LRR-repeat protein 15-like [Lutzomyia longipalpis]|uniref:F-box/LRR-repeat protein 15-like n=1 Tax=Lutzomyia longipalpis TaxID=7200 RepID=UPI0024836DEC|nr:F-box/LRR-repeat protein 15-like [Lutzomyia longipalpis]